MGKNKITIEMRRLWLSSEQQKKVNAALHKALLNQLEKNDRDSIETRKSILTPKVLKDSKSLTKTANIKVDFVGTNPEDSKLTGILNDEERTISAGGTITFSNVKEGDIIMIQGESLGTTIATIDISADPTTMTFSPGHFNDSFFIN